MTPGEQGKGEDMDRLIIENVRCFRGRHEVPLAPLTILVGENSTGKSTLLAMARIAWDIAAGGTLKFNEEPFLLGAFEQIAFSQPGKKISQSFIVGCDSTIVKESRSARACIIGEFTASGGQPVLRTWRFEAPPYLVEGKYDQGGSIFSRRVTTPSYSKELNENTVFKASMPMWLYSEFPLLAADMPKKDLGEILNLFLSFSRRVKFRPYTFAPIRTRPRRTYDPIQEIENPEGGHIPIVLAGMHTREPEAWSTIKERLEQFGRVSGLFSKMHVRHLGSSESDPFQLQVEIQGTLINLIDVGYGVSQILPILVECLRGEKGRMFLLQQPEVHLHPKAQAELGSFLVALAKQQNKKFLIETHSDYLVDRIRMDIRDKKNDLRPEDVAFLYFERQGDGVQIHRLLLDEQGDIVNAPPGYRKFILQEERRFLGI